MAKKKKNVINKKVHIKSSVKLLAVFLTLVVVLGLIFMNFLFTAALVLGILIILWLSNILEKKKKKKWVRIVINSLAIIILLVAIAGIGGVAWFLNYIVENAPEFKEDALTMTQTTKVYDNSGIEIAELGTEKREIIKYEQLNEELIDALIATEDSRFFQHNGFDAPRFIAASFKQALGNSGAGGASTLTMQVAKNSYNADKATVTKGFAGITRKFTDIYMAVFKIEQNYSKQEIIEFYLNNHFLGNNAYGIEQAALTYFNKHASELNIAESSLLIGMFQAPTTYNPFKYPEACEERRREVLSYMLRHGYITREEYDIAKSVPVSSLLDSQDEDQKYWSYLNTVVDEAIDKYGVNPHTTSVLIYTNMNSAYQTVIDDVLSGKTYNWENPVVQAGIAVVESATGKVVAIGAGRNQTGNRKFNYATATNRQIGSTAKPIFDYAPGIEFENWSTFKLFDDSKYYYSSGQEIRNSDRGYMGIITLRTALAQSRNIPALKAFQQVDNQKVSDFVVSLGLTPEICQTGYTYNREKNLCVNNKNEADTKNTISLHEAHSIGSFNGSNPLEMAGAYAAFANGGYYIEPYTINKIVFRDTGVVVTNEPEKNQVMSSATAFMITDVLKTAVNSGLSGAAKINGVNVAAKTGTTNYTPQLLYSKGLPNTAINDAWVIGYDPEYVLSIWYGYEPINEKYYTTAISAYNQRKGLFTAIGGKIFKKNGQDFQVPNTVIKVAVEMSGDVNREPKLASSYTPTDKIVYEWFKKGTEPTEVSAAYQRLSDVTGLTGKYDENNKIVTLSWNGIAPPTDNLKDQYGELGYKIFKDGNFIGFTTDTIYMINNATEPNGVYRVSAGYKNVSTVDSAGINYTISYSKPVVYKSELLVSNYREYTQNAPLDNVDKNPSAKDIKVTKDGITTNEANITITITDSHNNNIANITTNEEELYTITYTITAESYTNKITRKVKINKAEEENKPEEKEENKENE